MINRSSTLAKVQDEFTGLCAFFCTTAHSPSHCFFQLGSFLFILVFIIPVTIKKYSEMQFVISNTHHFLILNALAFIFH